MKMCRGAGRRVVEEWEDGPTEFYEKFKSPLQEQLSSFWKSFCRSIHPSLSQQQPDRHTIEHYYHFNCMQMRMRWWRWRRWWLGQLQDQDLRSLRARFFCAEGRNIMPKGLMISRLLDNGILIWGILKVEEWIIVARYKWVFGQKTNYYYRTSRIRRRWISPISIIIGAIIIHLGVSERVTQRAEKWGKHDWASSADATCRWQQNFAQFGLCHPCLWPLA